MKKNRIVLILLFAALSFLMVLAGCAPITDLPEEKAEEFLQTALQVQPMLSALSAAKLLYIPDTESRSVNLKTLNASTNNADWAAQTPSEVYGSAANIVRVPATNRLSDLNGNSGDEYYFELIPYKDDPANPGKKLFKVTLYIYPTLSVSVDYILEEYLVNDVSGGWGLVDENGISSPVSFIRYETHYYDGSVDYREINWANWDPNGSFYTTFQAPLLSDSSAYTFPAATGVLGITEPSKTNLAGYNYSADVLGTIPSTASWFREFYTEENSGGTANLRSALSYQKTSLSGILSGSENTVRRYLQNVSAGTKTSRGKTVAEISYSGNAWTKTVTEDISITSTTYDSVTIASKDGSTESTTTLELEKGGSGWAGTMTVVSANSTIVYNAALNTNTGLTLTTTSGTQVTTEIVVFNPETLKQGQQYITIEIPEGGTLEGVLSQGRINGLINSGRYIADVIITPTYVVVIYEQGKKAQ